MQETPTTGPGDSAERAATSLVSLRAALPEAIRALGGTELGEWCAAIDHRLLPRLRGELPLLVGLCGGGNAGKSTLFNLLAGAEYSPAGATAGLTRRALLGIAPTVLQRPDGLRSLVAPLGSFPERLHDAAELSRPGPALAAEAPLLPAELVLVDTPDFNVGDSSGYANRGQAQAVLEACDLLVYVATNQLYANREALAFMRETLTAVGSRPCVLVYRFDDLADAKHLGEAFRGLAQGLYGNGPAPVLARIVIQDDRTALRSGREPTVAFVRIDDGGVASSETCGVDGFRRWLIALDRRGLRAEDTRRTLHEVVGQAEAELSALRRRAQGVQAFRLALEIRQERAAAEAVQRFPLESFHTLVVGAYHAEESTLEGLARHIGRIPAWLRRTLKVGTPPAQPSVEAFVAECSALGEAQALLQELVEGRISVRYDPASVWGRQLAEALGVSGAGGSGERVATVEVPACFREEQAGLRTVDWAGSVAPRIEAAAIADAELDGVQEALRAAIRSAKQDRSRWDKLKHGFLLGAQIATPFAALAYVVGTGGAVLGLLGAKDLAAVVALPVWMQADAELSAVVRQLVNAVVGQWHARKRARLVEALRDSLTGPFLRKGKELGESADGMLARVEDAVRCLREATL